VKPPFIPDFTNQEFFNVIEGQDELKETNLSNDRIKVVQETQNAFKDFDSQGIKP